MSQRREAGVGNTLFREQVLTQAFVSRELASPISSGLGARALTPTFPPMTATLPGDSLGTVQGTAGGGELGAM